MKKRFTGILLLVIVAMLLGACSPGATAYLEETKKVEDWKYISTTMGGKMHMSITPPSMEEEEGQAVETMEPIKMVFDIKAEGVTINEDPANPKAKVILDMTMDDEPFMKKVEFLVDGNKTYLSKNYITDLMDKMAGEGVEVEIPEILQDEKITYILMESNAELFQADGMDPTMAMQMEQYLESLSNPAKMKELNDKTEKIAGLLDFDIPMAQEGRKFTTEITGPQLVDQVDKSLAALNKNFDAIVKELGLVENFGLTAENLAEAKEGLKELPSEEAKEAIAMAKTYVKDAKLSLVNEFADDKYLADFKFDLPIEGIGHFGYDFKSESKKLAEKPVINFPADEVCVDFLEVMEALNVGPEGLAIMDIELNEFIGAKGPQELVSIEKDGEILYGFRQIFEGLGYEVSYDAEAKEPCVKVNDKNECFELYIIDGVSYLSLDEVIDMGFGVEKHTDDNGQLMGIVITVD